MKPSLSAFQFALIAALCYGINGPLQKLAIRDGASMYGISLMYGAGIMLFGIHQAGKIEFFHSVPSFLYATLMGISGGYALQCISKAYGLSGGSVSLVGLTVASFPIISIAFGFAIFNEGTRLQIARFFLGVVLVCFGLYFALTSSK